MHQCRPLGPADHERRVVGQIAPPAQPAGPRRKLILGVAGLVGLLLRIGLAGVLEFFAHTFRGADDVARVLGTPLLLSVPRTEAAAAGPPWAWTPSSTSSSG